MSKDQIIQRIAISIAIFQYSITVFVGAGAGLVTYIDKHPNFDAMYGFLMAAMFFGLSIGIPAILHADKQASIIHKFQ